MSKYWSVNMIVYAGGTVYVEAESEEEARNKATEEFQGQELGICHQCAHEIDSPTYGEATAAYPSTEEEYEEFQEKQ